MKAVTLPLVFLLIATTGFAQESEPYRIFKDTEGRTIRAVIVRAVAKEVWIRRDDGRTFRVKTAAFQEADRDYIDQWRIIDALKDPNALEFAVRRYSDERETKSTKTRRMVIERYGYVVIVSNNTAFDLENLDIEYRYYALRSSAFEIGQDRERERHTGRARIATLPSLGRKEFQTATVPLESSSLRGNRLSDQRRTKDDLGGIWVRIKYGQQLIAEFSSPSFLQEEESW